MGKKRRRKTALDELRIEERVRRKLLDLHQTLKAYPEGARRERLQTLVRVALAMLEVPEQTAEFDAKPPSILREESE